MNATKGPKHESEQSFLRVKASDGHTHLLPYGHLIHVEFTQNNDDGIEHRIVMRFAVHSVFLVGSGLEKILKNIQNMTLSEIELTTSGALIITKIKVIDRGES